MPLSADERNIQAGLVARFSIWLYARQGTEAAAARLLYFPLSPLLNPPDM
jgi:hypothetical protein